MRRFMINHALSLGVAGVLALGVVTPLAAAPVMSNAAALNTAVPTDTDQVRWRGHRGGGAWLPGAVVGGLAAGAIIGSQAYRADPYYGGYAYQPEPYDGYGYSRPYYRQYRSMDRDCLGDYDSGGARC